jgi:hypothetical protein
MSLLAHSVIRGTATFWQLLGAKQTCRTGSAKIKS